MGHSLQGLQRGKELGHGCGAAISGVNPQAVKAWGGGSGVSELEGTLAHLEDLQSDTGFRGQHVAPRESLASLCHPLLPWALLSIPFT